MRILFARLLVGVTGLLIVLLAVVFAVIRNPSTESQVAAESPAAPAGSPAPQPAPLPGLVARGRTVYVEQRCRMCHSVGDEGNTRSPLDGVSRRLTEREIRLWIVAPQQMDPSVVKRAFTLSEEDLTALVAYLMAVGPR